MMKLLPNLPDYVVGISASGQIDDKDYETVLIPAVDRALKNHTRIRVLYQLTPAFTGFTSGAMWDDAKLGVAHLRAWERIAVVTDIDWIRLSVTAFGFLMPAQVNVYSTAEAASARKWISAV